MPNRSIPHQQLGVRDEQRRPISQSNHDCFRRDAVPKAGDSLDHHFKGWQFFFPYQPGLQEVQSEASPLAVDIRFGEDEDGQGDQEAHVDGEITEKRDLDMLP